MKQKLHPQKMHKYYLGLDSSAYTTSLCILDESGSILFEDRIVLDVKSGQRGLRQSEALYQHVRNFPVLFKAASPILKEGEVVAIGVSESPERREGSFMPVFLAGLSQAQSIASVTGATLYRLSHQENHLAAAEKTAGGVLPDTYYGVHFSGGTSEILRVQREGSRFTAEIVARSLDLKAGQLIDRCGVSLGLSFPAGRELEALAIQADEAITIPVSMEGADFHFSGPESRIKAYLNEGADPSELSRGLFEMIARTLNRSLRLLQKKEALPAVLFSGGVTANGIIREEMEKRLAPSGMRLFFSDPKYASDHALGCAELARKESLCRIES